MRITSGILLFLLINISGICQSDSTGFRNYFGVNISPAIGKAFGNGDNQPSRMGFSYRRCIGLYNLKVAFIGMNNVYPQFSYGNFSSLYNDSTEVKTYSSASNYSRDIRIGMERKWGSKKSKLFLGAGISFGKFVASENYTQDFYKIISDSVNSYVANASYNHEIGNDKSSYIKLGVDVWAGVAWDIGKHFNVMIQVNPDLSNYNLLKNERDDPSNVFPITKKNFTYLSLSSLDLMLGIRF